MIRSAHRVNPPLFLAFLIATLLVGVPALLAPIAHPADGDAVTGAPAQWRPPTRQPTAAPAVSPTDETAVAAPEAVDQAIWENGELLAPLPRDPMLRRQALDQALSNAAARGAANPGTPHTIDSAPGSSDSPAGMRSTEDPLLPITPYVPPEVARGEVTWNLKLPDQFVADPALLRGEDPATGAPLAQSVKDQILTEALAPAIKWWEGIGQTNLRPPDPDVSAGPNHVVAVVNARWAIYDKCGNNLYENDIAAFVGDATNFFFDPKVIYDVWDARWFITCCVRNNTTHASWVLLMYSDDDNPLGAWGWHYLDFTLNGGTPTGFWADYQDVGTSPDGVHITANQFDWSVPFSIFQYAKIRNLDKADVLNGGGVCWWDFWSLFNPGDGSLAFSLRACDMNSWPGDYWFVNSVSYGANFLTLWKLTAANYCAGPALVSYNLPVIVYDDPPAAPQPNGTYLDCGDARLINAVYGWGDIWTAHAVRYNWGEPEDRSIIRPYQLQPYPLTVSFQTGLGGAGAGLGYPAVDFDSSFKGEVVSSYSGTGHYGSTTHWDLDAGAWALPGWFLVLGVDNYNDLVNAGTAANPFRWGDYYGCDLDPYDGKTLWMYGEYAATTTSWGTRVGAASRNGPGVLSVTPSPGLVSAGYQGGPFGPGGVTYTLSNTGGAALTWSLVGVDFWNTATSTEGQLGPGASTLVSVNINASANAFGTGVFTDPYRFVNCYDGTYEARSTTLHIGTAYSCDGAQLALIPNLPPPNFATDYWTIERGVYVTAIKNFDVCALGYKLQVSSMPRTLEARIYAANGTTRGALLASGSFDLTTFSNVVQFVPVDYTLEACKDYELVFVIPGGDSWEWWDETGIAEPFDVGGAIRVRDGSADGGALNAALPHIEVIGTALPAPAMLTDLGGPGAAPNVAPDDFNERGIYVRMLDTSQLCSFGFEADLVAGQKLTARIYEATGTTRGALMATGTYTVPGSGMQWHDVPVNAQLLEGKDYDLAIEFGEANSWNWWDENTIAEPFTKSVFEVVTAEWYGDGTNFALPHYRAGWEEKTGGAPFDLPKITDVFPAPNSTNQSNSDYGAYVTAVVGQQVYSVGWMADIPAGQPITARVYEATGTTRGSLISEGTVYSSGPGESWHDVPVAVEMTTGADYDISIEWSGATLWRWWWDTSGMPYTINGVIQVRDGEAFGGNAAGWGAIPYLRICACNNVLTAVDDDHPQRTPMFIATPAPNPVSAISRLDFALEEAGPVSIHVYDVAGRRVSTILDGAQQTPGWHSVDLDSRQLASGVYFMKMQTRMQSVTRKFVVTH